MYEVQEVGRLGDDRHGWRVVGLGGRIWPTRADADMAADLAIAMERGEEDRRCSDD